MNKDLYLVLQLLLGSALVFFIVARSKGFPVLLFWPIFWGLTVVTFLIIRNNIKGFRTLAIIVYVLAMCGVYLAAVPSPYQMTSDGIFEAQFAATIVEGGIWNPEAGSGLAENYYGYTPVLHILTAFMSIATGLSSYVIVKYFLFVIYKLVIVMLVFLIIKELFSERLSLLATFIFAASAGFNFIVATRRSTGSIFLLLALYALIKAKDVDRGSAWNMLFYVFSAGIVLSNRTIAMYFLVFLFGAWIFSILIRPLGPRVFPKIFPRMLIFSIMFFLWYLFTIRIYLVQDASYIVRIYDLIKDFSFDSILSGTSKNVNIYRNYETFILYLSQLVFLLVGFLGLLVFLLRLFTKRYTHRYMLLYLAFFGFCMYAATPFLMFTEFDVAVSVMIWFFTIPVSIFFALFLARNLSQGWGAVFAVSLILLVFTGGILMGIYTPRMVNRGPTQDLVVGPDLRTKNLGLYQSVLWLEKKDKQATLLGDFDVFEAFSGFSDFAVNSYVNNQETMYFSADPIILKEKLDFEFGSYRHTLKRRPLNYLAFNNLLVSAPNDAFASTIPGAREQELDSMIFLDKTYANDDIILYKVRR